MAFVLPVVQLKKKCWTAGGETLGSSCSVARYMKLLTKMVNGWWEQLRAVKVSWVGLAV